MTERLRSGAVTAHYCFVIDPDGVLIFWQRDFQNPTPLPVTGDGEFPPVVSVVANNAHLLVLDINGYVWMGSIGSHNVLNQKQMASVLHINEELNNIASIYIGNTCQEHLFYALDHDGQLWTVPSVQLPITCKKNIPPLTAFSVSEISGGIDYSGKVWYWDKFHKPKSLNLPFETAIGIFAENMALKILDENGKLWLFREVDNLEKVIDLHSDLPPLRSVAVSGEHSIAIDEDGNAWFWGNNSARHCPVKPGRIFSPVKVNDIPPLNTIICGNRMNIAIYQDGELSIWKPKSKQSIQGLPEAYVRRITAKSARK